MQTDRLLALSLFAAAYRPREGRPSKAVLRTDRAYFGAYLVPAATRAETGRNTVYRVLREIAEAHPDLLTITSMSRGRTALEVASPHAHYPAWGRLFVALGIPDAPALTAALREVGLDLREPLPAAAVERDGRKTPRASAVADRVEKRCPGCDTVRPVEDFHPVYSRPDNRASHCQDCSRRNVRDSARRRRGNRNSVPIGAPPVRRGRRMTADERADVLRLREAERLRLEAEDAEKAAAREIREHLRDLKAATRADEQARAAKVRAGLLSLEEAADEIRTAAAAREAEHARLRDRASALPPHLQPSPAA